MPVASKLATLCLFIGTSIALGQSTTQEDLGTVTAAVLTNGLSWQVNATNEVEFAAAAAAGATRVRFDACEWSTVEQQSAPPNNVSAGYVLPAGCIEGLTYAKKYGLQPTIVAAYGSPFHQILTLTTTAAAAAGATTVAVEYSDGVGGKTLSSLSYPYDYLVNANGSLSNKNSYDGVLVTNISLSGSSAANLTLSSALSAALPAGTSLTVNEVLYPSPVTASPLDPSVIAYANFADYLAKEINAYGLKGQVELWNEPTWGSDCWDVRRNCYDVDPGTPNELGLYSPNYGFVAVLQRMPPVAGVSYIWAGTNKTGSSDLLNIWMASDSGQSYLQGGPSVTSESFHPYGSNPEDAMWNEPCVRASTTLNQAQLCNTTGSSANFVVTEGRNLLAKSANPAGGINHVITETGASSLYMPADHMARFDMRQFLGYMADDLSYINFYRLYDNGTPGQNGFSFITLTNNNTAFTPLSNYTALAGLMADLAPIKSAPAAAYTASSMPAVTSYSGTWDLDHLAVVGARAGNTANSIAYMLWQRSYSPTACEVVTVPCWASVPSPAGAPTTVSIPAGLKIDQVVNLDTRAAVSYTQTGASVTFDVSDDPIELMLIPTADPDAVSITPELIFETIPSQRQGGSVAVHANSMSTGAITYSIVSGPGTVSGSTVTATGPGTVVVKAIQAAKGNYASATTTGSFTVSALTPTLSIEAIQPRIYGAVVTMTAVSNSTGAITLSIVSGPATISGKTVTTTGVGMVVVEASQAASGAYTAATVTSSFTVSQATTVLSFASIPAQTYGNVFPVSATSASTGAVTYSVTSGPATVSGSTLTMTGTGEVWLLASQAASSDYKAATATYSFHVGAATPTLVFAPVANQPFSTSFTVSASSASSNAIIYQVVSGPASYVGSTITTKTTAGTVVLKAIQNGGGNWAPATATTSFTVSATAAATITVASIPSQVVGATYTVSASSPSSGVFTYSIISGPATISGSTVTSTGAGTVVIGVSQAASGKYSSGAATASFTVTAPAATPTLVLANISNKVYGNAFDVAAQSNSSGAITYSITSGAASISGSKVTVTGTTGTVIVKATQAASDKYGATSTTASFALKLISPNLAIAAIPTQTAGSTFTLNATSPSSGAISYSVVSGPATISNAAVTLTGTGSVVLRADQVASGAYGATHAMTSVQVN